MKNWIQNEINELQKILNDIKHFEEKAPSGTLRIHNKNGKTYYYRQMVLCQDLAQNKMRSFATKLLTENRPSHTFFQSR